MGLPDKTALIGNPTIGEYKTALSDFYNYVKGLHFWKPSTVVTVGDVVFKSYSNSSVYAKCTVAGTTGTTEPVWTGVGTTITDNSVTWKMYEITEADKAVLADNATKLKTARKINGILFDGSADINTELAGKISMFGGSFGGSDGKRPIDKNTGIANEGYAICDGTNGTTDLRGKFILAADAARPIGTTGGEETHALSVNEMPSHTHSIPRGDIDYTSGVGNTVWGGGTGNLTGSTGGNAAHNNMPPFYALALIMKL